MAPGYQPSTSSEPIKMITLSNVSNSNARRNSHRHHPPTSASGSSMYGGSNGMYSYESCFSLLYIIFLRNIIYYTICVSSFLLLFFWRRQNFGDFSSFSSLMLMLFFLIYIYNKGWANKLKRL